MEIESLETRNREPGRSKRFRRPFQARQERIPRTAPVVPRQQEEAAETTKCFQIGECAMTEALQQREPSGSDAIAMAGGTAEQQGAASASHLAHDARNWLTVLQVYCDLLRNSGAVSRDGRPWMEELSNAVERGQELVTSLLDSAQASTTLGSSPRKMRAAGRKTVDLAAVLQAREPLFRELAGSRIHVELKNAAHAETRALEEPEFDRILLNLVGNGIDAMPQGGRLTIELEAGDAAQERPLVLRVSDTGNGIPADLLAHIFESGFSTKPAAHDARSGRGYGLAIVRDLTLAAGGTVQVGSSVGHGTCFTIELPTQPAQARPQPAVSQKASVTVGSRKTRPIPERTRQSDNFGAEQKGTRVPC